MEIGYLWTEKLVFVSGLYLINMLLEEFYFLRENEPDIQDFHAFHIPICSSIKLKKVLVSNRIILGQKCEEN